MQVHILLIKPVINNIINQTNILKPNNTQASAFKRYLSLHPKHT